MAEAEIEVDAVLVVNKQMKLRTEQGQVFRGTIEAYECAEPYVIILNVSTVHDHTARVDVYKKDLSKELRAWIGGKDLKQPMTITPKHIDDAMDKFVKFGKPPKQEDFVLWIASRCELRWAPETDICFGGFDNRQTDLQESVQEGMTHSAGSGLTDGEISGSNQNPLSATAAAAAKYDKSTGAYSTVSQKLFDPAKVGVTQMLETPKNTKLAEEMGVGDLAIDAMAIEDNDKPTAAELAFRAEMSTKLASNTHVLTRSLIGRSGALKQLSRKSVKGRSGAAVTKGANLSGEHYRLACDIEKARSDVGKSMDERRKMIVTAKTRQAQRASHYRLIRSKIAEDTRGWFAQATEELLSLQKIKADIEDDVRKQKNLAHRASQKVAWTLAPPGYANRRGVSQPGFVIGPGPLPPDAIYSQRDPKMERIMHQYYWDSQGRRHIREREVNEDDTTEHIINHALEVIRRAGRTMSANKIDLKAVFRSFDTSGDGFLTMPEMAHAFLDLQVDLTAEALIALFHHFDPNDSGSVHYGEFMWAFFNRRDLVRKWRRNTKELTESQIRAKFHEADTNGNGRLNPKEFAKFLESFQIVLDKAELDVVTSKFDVDNDGELDLREFRSFLENEMKLLTVDVNDGRVPNQKKNLTSLKKRPSTAPSSRTRGSLHCSDGKGGDKEVKCNCGTAQTSEDGDCMHQNKDWTKPKDKAGQPLSDEEINKIDPHFVINAMKRQQETEGKIGQRYYKK